MGLTLRNVGIEHLANESLTGAFRPFQISFLTRHEGKGCLQEGSLCKFTPSRAQDEVEVEDLNFCAVAVVVVHTKATRGGAYPLRWFRFRLP